MCSGQEHRPCGCGPFGGWGFWACRNIGGPREKGPTVSTVRRWRSVQGPTITTGKGGGRSAVLPFWASAVRGALSGEKWCA